MSEPRDDLPRLVGNLAETVQRLQSELEPDRRPLGPPTPADLVRFTSEVTIPAIVLALETNIRALKLLQRTLRLASGRERAGGGTGEARDRAAALGRATLSRLDDALADLQTALEGRPPDDEARDLLAEARDLRAEIDDRLAGGTTDGGAGGTVDIDVESELRSIKDDLDDSDDERR